MDGKKILDIEAVLTAHPKEETIQALAKVKDFLLDPKNHKNDARHYYDHGFFLGVKLVENLIEALQED